MIPSLVQSCKVIPLAFIWVLFSFMNLQAQRYELVWSEEFEGDSLNRNIWTHWYGTAFNNELQFYTGRDTNIYVKDGLLNLVAHRERFGGREYTSGRIKSQGAAFFKFGYMEIRAKLPYGQGLWPAIWMMPEESKYGGWPHSGEIDIMEFRGNEVDRTSSATHYSVNGSHTYISEQHIVPGNDYSANFHVYSLEWVENEMRFFVDDSLHMVVNRGDIIDPIYPFNESFYFILNVAVGGNFLTNPDPSTEFPTSMQVDYVRVYQDANQKPVSSLISISSEELQGGETINFEVNASDTDGNVDSVEVFMNSESVAMLYQAPYLFTSIPLVEGCHEFKARAFDNDNGVGEFSEPVEIKVGAGCRRNVFGVSRRHEIPGVIDLLNYDRGGQNVGYYETTPYGNTGSEYGFRTFEGVDVRQDPNNPANLMIGDIEDGEWTSYTVRVQEIGDYDIHFYGANGSRTNKISLYFGDVFTTRFQRIPVSESYPDPTTKTNRVDVQAYGNQVLYVNYELTGPLRVDSLVFEKVAQTSVDQAEIPQHLRLIGNYPNPFNPSTEIVFSIPAAQNVRITVFNALGQKVEDIWDGNMPAGENRVSFDGSQLQSGMYWYKIQTSREQLTGRMTLVK